MSEKRLKGLAAIVGVAVLALVATGALLGSRSSAHDAQPNAGRSAATPGPPDTTPTLDLSRTGDGVTIKGTVPDADAAAGIKARVAEDFGAPVTGDLVIDPAVGDARWTDRLPDVFGDIVGVKGLELTIDGTGTLELAGAIESRAGADDVRRLVAATVPDLDVVSHLDVRPGDLPEADAAVLNSSTVYFRLHGSALDPEDLLVLDAVADVLQRHPDVSIEVGGHAGPRHPAAGERLSLDRVAAVKAYLLRSGIDATRISTRTFASDSQTADPTAKRFRRVDFVVTAS